jgi:hypothetical protein
MMSLLANHKQNRNQVKLVRFEMKVKLDHQHRKDLIVIPTGEPDATGGWYGQEEPQEPPRDPIQRSHHSAPG